ncbi:class GN sortase [Microbulbifer sp. SH-1]|uniref:class GN sortase n=1 Tax=Microbulbifer sp. SH-1 TaxID=2681547 RepID=UPI001F0DE2F1|nr:class GN sortase [Microbulbifer sp. SH-1]
MISLGKLMRWLPALLIGAGLWQLGSGTWVLLKAELAQYLISDSWQRQLVSGEVHKPWPWADTWPVAQLQLGDEKPLVVLQGISGQALAFGPGLYETSALPGSSTAQTTTVIAAHRDTHFRGLRSLRPNMPIQLQGRDGRWRSFRVLGAQVADSRSGTLPAFAQAGDVPDLILVTCYPFDALDAGGPLRYLVYAESAPDTATDHIVEL